MRRRAPLLVVAAAVSLVACNSGNKASCNLNGGTQLAATTWPSFRADPANSGRANVDLTNSTGNGQVVFSGHCSVTSTRTCIVDAECPVGELCVVIGSVSTTPILGPQSIFVASSDGNVYIVDYSGRPVALPNEIQVQNAIAGSPLLGADGTLFVPSNSTLTQFFPDGAVKNTASLLGFISASPNIWNGDGTVFIGTQSAQISAVCPNGVSRFSLTFPATESTAAITQAPNTTEVTPIVIAGGINGQVRSFNIKGRQFWSFFASANVDAAVLIDTSTNLFYIADASGHVFAGDVTNGHVVTGFSFAATSGITASPALGRDTAPVPTLYVADLGGTVYALDRDSGEVRWTFQADGPITSSPAVATGGADDVIVFAADILGTADPTGGPVAVGGLVYAVLDDGGSQPTLLWTFDAEHAIGASSPAIAADGTVYIGRQGSRLGNPDECPNVDKNHDGVQDACLVNDGGALYAIGG